LLNILKPVFALIISILIFAGYNYLADEQLLNFIQTRFYNPAAVQSYVKENNIDADLIQNHIIELQEKFSGTLQEHAVRSSFLHNQSAEDIYERSRVFGILLESVSGLQSVQFIDNNGVRIHYSTSVRDILSQNRDSTSYRNYNEDLLALPYEIVSVPDGSGAKYTMDERGGRIIFSFPFYDSMDVYRGTAVYNMSVRALAERLVAQGRLKVSEDVSVIGDPPGILLAVPETSKADIHQKAAEIWKENYDERSQLSQLPQLTQLKQRVVMDSEDSDVHYSLISSRTSQGIFLGRLINDYLFSISEPMKLILKLSMFLTFFLTLFFLFNFKPNPATVVRNRLRRLRDSLFEQLYGSKSAQERLKWILELEQRRDEIRKELKRGMKLKSRTETSIDGIINKSWDEMLAIVKAGNQTTTIVYQKTEAPAAQEAEDLEEILEEAEPVTEAEGLEEVDEIGSAEEIGEAEELAEIEEIDEIDEIEEIGEVEEIGKADDLEEIGEAEELDEIEEINIIDVALREALEPAKPQGRGLLGLASLFENKKAAASSFKGKGLLAAASMKKPRKGLLELASSMEPAPEHKGLLAHAEEKAAAVKPSESKNILAYAEETDHEYPVMDHETEELLTNFDIVSPFSSMFTSLDDEAKG